MCLLFDILLEYIIMFLLPLMTFEYSLPLFLQVNCVSVTLSTNIPSKSYQTSVRNGRWRGLSIVTKAKVAVEGDVLEKESVSVNDKGGNSSDFSRN